MDFYGDDDDTAPAAEVAPVLEGVSDAQLARMRAQVREQVEVIRSLERKFHAAHHVYLDCGTEAEARARMALQPATWSGDNCWTTLGFAPGSIVGGYTVTVDSRGYRVQGWLDTDHDGNPAMILGTRDLPATFTTPSSVR